MSKRKRTIDDTIFIKENYDNMTAVGMAASLDIHVNTLRQWCDELGVQHGRKAYVKPGSEPSKPRIKRPPSVYSNQSREQHIERILNIEL